MGVKAEVRGDETCSENVIHIDVILKYLMAANSLIN